MGFFDFLKPVEHAGGTALGFLNRNIATPIVHDVKNAADVLNAGRQGVQGLANIGVAAATGNNVAENNAINKTNKAINYSLNSSRGLYTPAQARSSSVKESLIKPIAKGTATYVPFFLGGVGGAAADAVGAEAGAARLGVQAATNFGVNTGIGVAGQATNGQPINLGQAAKGALAPTAFSSALEAIPEVKNAIANKTKPVFADEGIPGKIPASLLEKLSKSGSVGEVKSILHQGLPEDVADKIAPAIAKTNDPNIIQSIVDKAQPALPNAGTSIPRVEQPVIPPAPEPELLAHLNNPALVGQDITPPKSLAEAAIPKTEAVKPPEVQVTEPTLKAALDNATKPTNVDLTINPDAKIKETATGIRTDYSGELNRQKLAGQQLADAVHKVAPGEEKGIFWYNEAKGSAETLQKWLHDPNPNLEPHHIDIEQALHLSDQGKEAAAALTQYYEKAGANAAEQGSIKSVIQDYGNNRLYQQEKTNAGVTGDLLKQTTGHAKERVYPTVADAVINGKVPVTTDAADLAALHSTELAKVNTTRNLLDNLETSKLGTWVDTSKDRIPTGYKQIGDLRKGSQVFVAPEELAKKLRPITEPDFLSHIDKWRQLNKYQGLVKTVDLSYSLFHHLTLAAQLLYQTKLGADLVKNSKEILGSVDSPEFAAVEQNFAKYGGITSKVEATQDIMRNLVGKENEGLYGKVTNIPGVKQVLAGAQKSTSLLFETGQRWLKVNDFQTKITNWAAKHTDATPEEFKAAAQGYAKEVNAAYGGLNWQSIGVTQTGLRALRTVLLAPDWVVSNFELGKYGISKGTAGNAARAHLFTALASGMVATEVLNKSITGHFTNENPKGHEFEVQIAPNVYVSVLRGGIGDLLKLAGNIQDSGVAQGTARFTQGKLSPFARTAVGLLSGTQYTGQKISQPTDTFAKKSLNEAKFIATSAAPIPFGVSSTLKYKAQTAKDNEPFNPAVAASLGSGVARFTKTSNNLSDAQNKRIANLAKKGASKDVQKAYEQYYLTSKKTTKDRTAASNAINDALTKGDTTKAQKIAKDFNTKYAASFKGWSQKYGQYADNTLTKDYKSNKINLTSASIKTRLKTIKANEG